MMEDTDLAQILAAIKKLEAMIILALPEIEKRNQRIYFGTLEQHK